jgi:hypothetical protein
MATYYVRTDGSDLNAGTGPATNQAWQTITKAIGATGIAPGDTLYIAPGVYRGTFSAAFTNPASEGQRVTIAGNPTASQFTGVTAGPVVITNFLTNTTTSAGNVFVVDKDYVTIQDLSIVGYNLGGFPNYFNTYASTGIAQIINRCLMYQPSASTEMYFCYFAAKAGSIGPTISQCVFLGGGITLQGLTHSGTWNSQTTVRDCIIINPNTFGATSDCIRLQSQTGGQNGGIKIINCYLSGTTGVRGVSQMSTSFPSIIQNCLIEAPTGIFSQSNNGQITQSYNVLQSSTSLTNVASSVTTITNGFACINGSLSKIQGWGDYPFISALVNNQAGVNGGINTNSLASDIYGTTWLSPSTPTVGASEYQSYTPSSVYLPTERNASTITIAPGSTSQSIELYLGATGLTASTSGLSARYNRTRTASVSIPLVARTIAQAWTAGGFAEVDATNMPGVYRLDLPDAALASGADDVTIVVRGASGTNGAVMTVKLSSGGLTEAQTASAVWGADPSSYTTATDFGGVLNETRSVVGSTEVLVQGLPQAVWDEPKSGHATPGTFGAKLQDNVLADELLSRDVGSGSGAGTVNERTVRSALRGLRNKTTVINNEMTVYKEDDTTTAWSATVSSSDSSKTITGVDPT